MNHIPSPDTSDSGIEREIIAKGKTAPRVTPAGIEANIISEHYFSAREALIGIEDATDRPMVSEQALGLLTFCVLVLKNGFTVTGESACASPENFDPEIGMKIARANAVQKIWPLMGYQLKEQLYQAVQPAQPPSDPYPYDTGRPGANIHGIGPDTDGGPNPHFKA